MAPFTVRPAAAGDARAMAELFAAVAGERTGIATEPPVDIDERAAQFARTAAGSVVAVGRRAGRRDAPRRGQPARLRRDRHAGRPRAGGAAGSVRRWSRRRSAGRAARGCTSSALRYSRTTRPRSPCTVSPASWKRDGAPGNTGGPAASCGTPSSWVWPYRGCEPNHAPGSPAPITLGAIQHLRSHSFQWLGQAHSGKRVR